MLTGPLRRISVTPEPTRAFIRIAGPAFIFPRHRAPPVDPTAAKLALIYNEQGLRPAEIAHKLGVSTYRVIQIILSAKNRARG